ncbi:type I-D CRISPR-associated protein Cas10d/Csc3 [Nostoc sp. 106C]|uniref:type I-D CRISPR-associated protein Cas10d/Csc3 n=1 Tax=Nostoc sp. 106C TaxID=1932667 RepID=UPI000A3979BD|nr:type I-D CRISPR-associated protein Cas10d/Csc3 [Nostoc sp. 106C]OUL21989.1 type I-D CRISPR-associated protein Cas10d/Csc3 [Nostoc sp. 106C]
MAKKRENAKAEQLELFSYEEETDLQDQLNEDFLEDENEDEDEDLGFGFGTSKRDVSIEQELLTLKLLKEAILTQNPDEIMADFANHVLPNLLRVAIGVTAKGGKWIENKEQELEALGETLDRRNAGDQSLNTHLLNGLFPANLIEQRLEKLDTTVKRVIRETERRLLIASFILHDFEKFDYDRFPEMPQKYKNIQKDKKQKIRDLSILEHREIIDVIIRYLKLDYLINPQDNQKYREYLDDILCTAYNTQRRWDTNWNFSEHSELKPKLKGDKLVCLAALACLADRLASIIKHPKDALKSGINNIVGQLSNRQLKLSYHSIAENRGVLTNVVNNALIDAHKDFNTEGNTHYEPLLYLPTGVIYLTHRKAPPVKLESIPERVVENIKSLCAGELKARQTGFSRDGKGMKYADYYSLFFDTPELMQVALKATKRILKDGKKPVSKDRSDNLIKFQKQNILSLGYNFQFNDDIRIDQIAEFGDLVSRKIWGEKVKKIEDARKQRQNERKKNKALPEIPAIALVAEDLICKVAEFWNLSEYIPVIREIQRINETLKEHKLKGNTGGVPYEWYFLAAKYLQKHPGIEDVRPVCEEVIAHISQLIEPIATQYVLPDGWDDLRVWVTKVIMLPETGENCLLPYKFLEEFESYKAAKKNGRGRQLICSISHSSYTVTEQMESAVLFAPQVYTNKQMLGGSNAKRNISSIAGIEIMLRQILMSQTQANGGRFEDAKYRYLYFYPTYYCTPETNAFLHKAYDNIKQTRFDTGVRNHFISKDLKANFGLERYQNADLFYIDESSGKRNDRTFKLSYSNKQPLTFYFMALPPEVRGKDKKPTDTESWIMPAWLSFAFPMILDVKTVVSESPIPPFTDGAEFEESVFLDSAPQAFRVLLKEQRFRLDYILEGWKHKETNKQYPSPLNLLTAAYAIHLDVHSKQSKTGYDPNWGKFSELAKDFETSPLYIFAYLNEWVRKQKIDAPSINKVKLYAYHFYPCFDPDTKFDSIKEELIVGEESSLNHPKKLTELYRRFYRAKSSKGKPIKSNAILKPIDEAADTIIKADKEVFKGEVLVDAVAAKIFKLMERVRNSTAEGRWVIAHRDEERDAILDFARYFVLEVFEKSFAADRARLAGRQLNLIKDTCEFLYRLENDKERREKANKSNDEISDDSEDED